MFVRVYNKILSKETRLDEIRIKCDSHQEWCDLYSFAKSVGQRPLSMSNHAVENLWLQYEQKTYLTFDGDTLRYGYGPASNLFKLCDTDIYDVIYPSLEFSGSIMSILDC